MATLTVPKFTAMKCNTTNGSGPTPITATTNRQSLIFYVGETVTIDRLVFRTLGNTGSPLTIVWTAQLQGVTATRKPDGTVLGATNNGTGTVAHTASAFLTVTLGETVALTPGFYAIVVFISSAGTLDAGNCPNLAANTYPNGSAVANSPYRAVSTDSGSTYTVTSAPFPFSALEADGTVHGCPCLLMNAAALTNASTPRYWGTSYTPPYDAVVSAIEMTARGQGDTRDFIIEVFEEGNTTPIFSITVNNDEGWSGTAAGYARFPVRLNLTAGLKYDVTLRSTTADLIVSCNQLLFAGAEHMRAAGIDPTEFEFVTSPGTVSFSYTANSVAAVSLEIESFDVPDGGIKVHTGMSGGMNG